MRTAPTLFAFIFFHCSLQGQDTHYWFSPYCTGGGMVGGAVISRNNDSGVLYINPALLVEGKMNTIAVQSTVYRVDDIRMKNGVGVGYDLHSRSTATVPLLIAGNVRLPLKKPVYLAYGIINAPGMNFSATQRRDELAQVLAEFYSPGKEQFVGQYILENRTGKSTVLGSAATTIGSGLSAGITIEGTKRSGNLEYNYIARTIVNPPGNSLFPIVSTDLLYHTTYSAYSLRMTMGLAANLGNNHFGLTMALPEWNIGGKGEILADEVINNVDYTLTGHPLSLIANTRQENLDVKWKEPLSLAFGYSKPFNKLWLNGSVEYFFKVDEYPVVEPSSNLFIRPDTAFVNILSKELLTLKDNRTSVLNWSIAANYIISSRFSVLASLRTDKSYAHRTAPQGTNGFYPYLSDWNIYHWQVGVNWKRAKYRLQVGIYFSHGKNNNYLQDINFTNVSETNFLQGDLEYIPAKYFSTGLSVSYVHNF